MSEAAGNTLATYNQKKIKADTAGSQYAKLMATRENL